MERWRGDGTLRQWTGLRDGERMDQQLKTWEYVYLTPSFVPRPNTPSRQSRPKAVNNGTIVSV